MWPPTDSVVLCFSVQSPIFFHITWTLQLSTRRICVILYCAFHNRRLLLPLVWFFRYKIDFTSVLVIFHVIFFHGRRQNASFWRDLFFFVNCTQANLRRASFILPLVECECKMVSLRLVYFFVCSSLQWNFRLDLAKSFFFLNVFVLCYYFVI